MQQMRAAMVVALAVASGCRSSGVTVRDDRGQVRAILSVDGLMVFDGNGKERLAARVGADGRPMVVLRDGTERMELSGTGEGWALTVGREGDEPKVALTAPRWGDACLRVGATAVGCPTVESDIVGLTVADEEGRERVVVGMKGSGAGVRVADRSGRQRAALYVVDDDTPVVLHLSDGQGATRVYLGAETGAGGWVEVMDPGQRRQAVVSSEALRLRTARGEFYVAVDDQGYPVLRLVSSDETRAEIGVEGGEEPYLKLRNAKGEVQRVPAK